MKKPRDELTILQKASWFYLGLSTGAMVAAITALAMQLLR